MTSLPAEPGLRGGLRLARGHRGAQRSRWGMVGHGASCEAQVMNQCSKPRLIGIHEKEVDLYTTN